MEKATIQAKCRVDADALKEVQKLAADLRKYVSSIESVIGQINAKMIDITIDFNRVADPKKIIEAKTTKR